LNQCLCVTSKTAKHHNPQNNNTNNTTTTGQHNNNKSRLSDNSTKQQRQRQCSLCSFFILADRRVTRLVCEKIAQKGVQHIFGHILYITCTVEKI
jgi:hypothetical protein